VFPVQAIAVWFTQALFTHRWGVLFVHCVALLVQPHVPLAARQTAFGSIQSAWSIQALFTQRCGVLPSAH
jgi:hypothetical protein